MIKVLWLLLAFLCENIFSLFISNTSFLKPLFVLIVLLKLTKEMPKKEAFIWSFLTGLFYDILTFTSPLHSFFFLFTVLFYLALINMKSHLLLIMLTLFFYRFIEGVTYFCLSFTSNFNQIFSLFYQSLLLNVIFYLILNSSKKRSFSYHGLKR